MVWFIILAYTFFVYGMSVIFTQSIGPFNIFFRLRMWAESVGPNFGLLFKCMTCFPTNVGWVFSLLWNIDDYIDKNTPIYEDDVPDDEDSLKKKLEDIYGN